MKILQLHMKTIKNEFGIEVADGVLALSKNSELPIYSHHQKNGINQKS